MNRKSTSLICACLPEQSRFLSGRAAGVLASALGLLLLAVSGWAQSITGNITGSVRDSSSLAVPGASVKLTDARTGAVRETQSNERGDFTFTNLQPGGYHLAVMAQGFKALEKRSLNLTASETLAVGELVLEVGALTETVTITAQGATVQTASSERSGVVTASQVENLAIRGRNVTSLARLLPGVVLLGEDERLTMNWNFVANGNRRASTNMQIDGASINDSGNNNSAAVYVSMDAVSEVKILLSNYQAEYGRFSGASVSLVTKSGGREFHGLGSYFKRHEQFNANNFFNNRLNQPRPKYRFNTWNFNVGGPIYIPGKFNRDREKLFFFFSEEYWPVRLNRPLYQLTVPTELERRGDFSQSVELNGARIPVVDPTTRQPVPGNIIPASRVDPNGTALLKVFPLPNFTDISVSARRYNWVAQDINNEPRRAESLRLDYNASPRDPIFFSYTHRYEEQTGATGVATSGSTNWSQMRKTFFGDGKLYVGRYTRIFSPTLVNELNVSFVHRPQGDSAEDSEIKKNQRSTIGFTAGQFNPKANPLDIIPNATFGGVTNAANLFVEQRFPHSAMTNNISITNNLTKIWRSHNFKAGFFMIHDRPERKLYAVFNGSFTFARNVNNPLETGFAYSNAAFGVFNSYTEASDSVYRRYRMNTVEWFFQDNWKVSRKLTFDLGLRMCYLPNYYDAENKLSVFDPARFDPAKAVRLIRPATIGGRRVGVHPVTGQEYPAVFIGAIAPGVGDVNNGMASPLTEPSYPRGLVENRRPWLAPRFGFAYDLAGNGKTAIRGGFGLFYNREALESSANPFAIQRPIIENPVINYGTLSTLLSSQGFLFPENVQGIDRYGRGTPKVMNYSLGVQRQVGFGTVLDVSYVGSLGRNYQWRTQANPIPLGANFDPRNADPTNPRVPLAATFLRPLQGYNSIAMAEWGASSNYNSLQTAVNRRFARQIEFGLSWTWSKTMSYVDTDQAGISPLVERREWYYGPASFDRTHVANISWLWTLPKTPWSNPVLKGFLHDWQLSGITTFTSGAPMGLGYGLTTAADLTGTPDLGSRIIVTGPIALPKGERTFNRYFNTANVRMPRAGDLGNAHEYQFRGPGINNWDISVFKAYPIRERVRLQYRLELYNAFNHTQFSAVDNTARFDTATGAQVNARFGELTAARNPRQIQMALRLTF